MDFYLFLALCLGLASALALYVPFRRVGHASLSVLYVLASAAVGVLAYHLTLLWVFEIYGPASDALWAVAYAFLFFWDLVIALAILLLGGSVGPKKTPD
jgi:hypothetical protein